LSRFSKEIRHLNNGASERYFTDIDCEETLVSASDGASTGFLHVDVLRLAHVKPRDAIKFAKSGRLFLAPE